MDIAAATANLTWMAFVAYLFSLVAAFIGVMALYGVLLKPLTAKRPPPAQAVAEEKAGPATTNSIPARSAAKPKRHDAAEAHAEASPDGPVHPVPRTSRRSPVHSESGEGLRLKPERCWIITDKTRNYGYYGECR